MIADATFTDGNRVACPASADFLDPLAASYKLHYTTQKQISKFGLCRKCRQRMKEHGKSILAGKVETPGPMVPPPAEKPDGAAWQNVSSSGEGRYAELTPTCEFDHDEIDQRNGWHEAGEILHNASEQARHEAGEVLREIFQFCYGTQRKRFGAKELQSAAMRLAIIVSGLRPDILNDATHGELARHLSRTKAAASKASCAFEDRHHIQFARSRSLSGRAKMRARRLAQGGVARNKPKADTGHGATQLGTSNQPVTYKPAEAGGQAEGAVMKASKIIGSERK